MPDKHTAGAPAETGTPGDPCSGRGQERYMGCVRCRSAAYLTHQLLQGPRVSAPKPPHTMAAL